MKYSAKSLDDIAAHFAENARRLREKAQIESARSKKRAMLEAEAFAWEAAAEILRQTELQP